MHEDLLSYPRSLREKLVRLLGGYTKRDVDNIAFDYEKEIEHLEERIEEIPDGRGALARIVKDHFNGISADDLLRSEEKTEKAQSGKLVKRKVWYHKGKPIDAGKVEQLKKEAQEFYQSDFYDTLQKEIEYHATRVLMANNAKNADEIIPAKMLIYLSDIIKTKIKQFIEIK